MRDQQLTDDDVINDCQEISFVVIKSDIQKERQSRTLDKWWYNVEDDGTALELQGC